MSSPPVLGTVTVVLTPDIIENAITNPVLVVPAQGAGYAVIPTWFVVEYNPGPNQIIYSSSTGEEWMWWYGATQPSSTTNPWGTTTVYPLSIMFGAMSQSTGAFQISSVATPLQFISEGYNNLPLYMGQLSDASAPWMGGDGTATVVMHYTVQPTTSL